MSALLKPRLCFQGASLKTLLLATWSRCDNAPLDEAIEPTGASRFAREDVSMELMDAIRNRRAVRDYTNTAVERSVVERLIGAAISAPSAMNLQPWSFAILLGRERIDGYARRAKDWLLGSLSQTSYEPSIRHRLEDPDFVLFYHAPALVIVLAKSSGTQAAEDCCLAAENLMLAARNEGLGSCWIGFARPWLDLPATKSELKLPEHYHVVAPIVLGYPKAWPDSHGRNPPEMYWL